MQILLVVGIDIDNFYYPNVFEVVKSEYREAWEWFLNILKVYWGWRAVLAYVL